MKIPFCNRIWCLWIIDVLVISQQGNFEVSNERNPNRFNINWNSSRWSVTYVLGIIENIFFSFHPPHRRIERNYLKKKIQITVNYCLPSIIIFLTLQWIHIWNWKYFLKRIEKSTWFMRKTDYVGSILHSWKQNSYSFRINIQTQPTENWKWIAQTNSRQSKREKKK